VFLFGLNYSQSGLEQI